MIYETPCILEAAVKAALDTEERNLEEQCTVLTKLQFSFNTMNLLVSAHIARISYVAATSINTCCTVRHSPYVKDQWPVDISKRYTLWYLNFYFELQIKDFFSKTDTG